MNPIRRPDLRLVEQPGDVIVADEIGIAVVPATDLEKVLAAAREQAQREEATRRRIKQGRTLEAAAG